MSFNSLCLGCCRAHWAIPARTACSSSRQLGKSAVRLLESSTEGLRFRPVKKSWRDSRSQRPLAVCIYLDKHMLRGVYQANGICVRNHCGAEPPRDIEPSGLVTTVGWRDRASASYAAAERVKASASAARGRFRGIHGGRTAPSLPAEARTTSAGGCLAGSVPSVLVRSRRCSRTPPRPHGSINTNEKEDKEKTARPQPRARQSE